MVATVCSLYQQQLSYSWWDRRGPDWEEHSQGLKVITKRSDNRNLLFCCDEYVSWHLKSGWSKSRRCYRATRIKERTRVSTRVSTFKLLGGIHVKIAHWNQERFCIFRDVLGDAHWGLKMSYWGSPQKGRRKKLASLALTVMVRVQGILQFHMFWKGTVLLWCPLFIWEECQLLDFKQAVFVRQDQRPEGKEELWLPWARWNLLPEYRQGKSDIFSSHQEERS